MSPLRLSNTQLVAFAVLISVGLSQAMLPPPILRAACGAFADAEEVVGAKILATGKAAAVLAMKPIAIAGGLKAAAVGTAMKVNGGAMKFVGAKLVKDGALMEATGAGVKGAGLGVAALALKPAAEKIFIAGKAAEKSLDAAHKQAENFAKTIGDTSIQIDATIDSPVLGHHHKEVSAVAGLNTALKGQGLKGEHGEQQVEQQIEQVQQIDEHNIIKRAAKIDGEVMRAALNLVKEAKMEDCVARAICDLNCNPQGFGQDGKQVFMNMVRLQGANVLEQEESKYFHDAASKGRSNSGNCDQCSNLYDKCKSKTADLIRLASHIRLD